VVGHSIVDTIEGAALEAIYLFCNQHPRKLQDSLLVYSPQQIPTILSGISG
jgi:hypothetical protein